MAADDSELLRRYAKDRAEEAFAELVQRYVSLVYHAALRQAGGNAAMAEDVTQQVFTLLARKAASLGGHRTLAGWLHTTTRYAASQAMRTERRRRAREQEAHLMHEQLSNDPIASADWEDLRPVIDEALGELNERDREAVLLRFFAGLPLADIGEKLNLSENTARMRVERALEKLRALLARRGVTSTGAALGAAMANEAACAVPIGLAATVTGTALAGGSAAVAAGWIGFMSTSKTTLALAALALAVALGGGIVEFRANRESVAEMAAARRENAGLTAKIGELSRRVAAVSDEGGALKRAVAAASAPPAPAGGARGGRGGGGGGGGLGSEELNTPEALEAGRAFLAQHPEARRALELGQRESFEGWVPAWFAALRLSPEELEAVYGEVVRLWPWQLRVSGIRASMGADGSHNSQEIDPFVRQLVGEERFRRYETNRGRESPIAQLAETLAGASAVHDGDSPLSPEQVAAFVRILERHSALTRRGPLDAKSPVWTVAMPEVAQVLSADQLATLKLVLDSGAATSRGF